MIGGIPVNDWQQPWLKHGVRISGAVACGRDRRRCLSSGRSACGAVLTSAAIVVLIVNEIYAARARAAVRWVIDIGRGFGWAGGPAIIEVSDCDVIAVRLKQTPRYVSGGAVETVRRFDVWTSLVDRPFSMTNRLALDDADPLAGLIARLTRSVKERTAADMSSGDVPERAYCVKGRPCGLLRLGGLVFWGLGHGFCAARRGGLL